MLQILIRHRECKNNHSHNGWKKIAKPITQSEIARFFKILTFYRYMRCHWLVVNLSTKSELDSMLQALVTDIRQTEDFNEIRYIIDWRVSICENLLKWHSFAWNTMFVLVWCRNKKSAQFANAQHPFLQALIHCFSTSRDGLFPKNTKIVIFLCRSQCLNI
jgi:hypothetical protein